ncbi:terminase small subunit [Henriciella pelagia]|uniref:terminase small subunit n=1 Tax=Henriciella pelagia TaxID=1977912 RepID=UPI0035149ABA
MPAEKLTPKQERFCREYVIDHNGKQAAIRTGYAERSAEVQASRLLSNDKVREFIAGLEEKATEKLEITKDRIMQEYARIGFSDPRKFLTAGGGIIDPRDWDDDTAAAVASFELVARHDDEKDSKTLEYVHKIKTWDKLKALDAMGKHLGMFDGKKGADDPDDDPDAANLREIGRKLAFVLAGAAQAQPE